MDGEMGVYGETASVGVGIEEGGFGINAGGEVGGGYGDDVMELFNDYPPT